MDQSRLQQWAIAQTGFGGSLTYGGKSFEDLLSFAESRVQEMFPRRRGYITVSSRIDDQTECDTDGSKGCRIQVLRGDFRAEFEFRCRPDSSGNDLVISSRGCAQSERALATVAQGDRLARWARDGVLGLALAALVGICYAALGLNSVVLGIMVFAVAAATILSGGLNLGTLLGEGLAKWVHNRAFAKSGQDRTLDQEFARWKRLSKELRRRQKRLGHTAMGGPFRRMI